MADLKITQLNALAVPVLADLLASVDDPAGAAETKKLTLQALRDSGILDKKAATYIVAADGSGDFTDIQDGIDALPAGGGLVYVREGTYTLAAGLTLAKSNVTLIGSGEATIITLANTVNQHLLTIGDGATAFENIQIRNCKIDGNRANQAGTLYGIYANKNITNLQISGVVFDKTKSQSIYINTGCASVVIVENKFLTDAAEVSITDADRVFFQNNDMKGTRMAGINVYYSNHILIAENYLESTGDEFATYGEIFLYQCRHANVLGNIVKNHAYNQIWIMYSQFLKINGNDCSGAGGMGTGDGINISNSNYGSICANNIYRCNTGLGLFYSGNFAISGNTFLTSTFNGIYLVTCADISVTGNHVKDSSVQNNNTYFGIGLDWASVRCTVVGNTVIEQAVNRAKYGICEQHNGTDYNLIAHNVVHGAGTANIYGFGLFSKFSENILVPG